MNVTLYYPSTVGDDPEVVFYGRKLAVEMRERGEYYTHAPDTRWEGCPGTRR